MVSGSTLKTIFKQVGSLLILEGIIIFIPSLVSLIYSEVYSALGFFLAALFSFGIGIFLYYYFKDSEDVRYNNALIIAAMGWLAITLMGGFPFFIIAHITPEKIMNSFIPPGADYSFSSLIYFKNYLHCFFESMSAFTTTGLTMAVHEPSVGNGVLFYRSLAQWFGGAGFIIMVLAVFRDSSGQQSLELFSTDSSVKKFQPRIIDTARAIWKTYLFVTLFSVIYLIIGTYLILPDYPLCKNVFDSINHAMAGQSTGGFSTLDDSISGYHSAAMEMLYLLPMILGSFSITFYYRVLFDKKLSEIWEDIQTRALLFAFLLGSVLLSLLLLDADNISTPFRTGIFQFVSAMSTTGWQTSDIARWDWLSIVFVVAGAMFIGGASGATVGGIKMIRALTLKKGLQWQVNSVFFSKNTIKFIRFNGKSMLPQELNKEFTKAAALAILFFLFTLAGAIITALYTHEDYSFAEALFESSSAQSTVGLSAGITNPHMSPVLEVVYIFQMWSGRLEIIPVLVLIRSIFWGTEPRII